MGSTFVSSRRTCQRRRPPQDTQPALPLPRRNRQCMQAPTGISTNAGLGREGHEAIARSDNREHRTTQTTFRARGTSKMYYSIFEPGINISQNNLLRIQVFVASCCFFPGQIYTRSYDGSAYSARSVEERTTTG